MPTPVAPTVNRQTRAFLEVLNSSGGEPMETLSPGEARKVLEGAQTSVKLEMPPADVETKTIPTDAGDVLIYIVRPKGATGVLPAFLFIHGGGWVLGDFPTHERFVRDMVVYSGAVAVFVEYTRSPEAKFPAAINQAYGALKWVAEKGKQINIDPTRLAVVGNSVGGNMTAAVALMAKDKGGPKIRFQLMFWPVTDAKFDTVSYEQFQDSHFLTRNMMKWFWNHYTHTPAEQAERYASVMRVKTDDLKGLPPALVQVAENDVLRDEGEAYARKLDAAGVDVTLERIGGMIHDYGLLNPLAKVPAVQSALQQAADQLRRHLA